MSKQKHRLAILASGGPAPGINSVIAAATIEANCVIARWTTIGKNNHIQNGTTIGVPPQDVKYKGEKGLQVC